ncbi:uncharacterized protein LOC110450014 [Mizuhopecten yessoensis]|uniref:uncharacterized protein LOC110450014 n=1 Tax=Mizuhopecten yessoensis TaxID=6573 RepID=UPI000B45B56D|nr:uncharacterized protein LOC110450014 [Mizuhopecten yessoensis]
MLSFLALLVVITAASRVECSCLEISSDGTTDAGCAFNDTTLQVGQVVTSLHPECMSYTCVRTNVIRKCGIGYNDDNYPRLPLMDSPDVTCTETQNPDCTVNMVCVGTPVFASSDMETPNGSF